MLAEKSQQGGAAPSQALFYVPVQFEFQEVEKAWLGSLAPVLTRVAWCSKAKQLFTEKSRLWNLISDWKAVTLSVETSEGLGGSASFEEMCMSDRRSWMSGRRPTLPS